VLIMNISCVKIIIIYFVKAFQHMANRFSIIFMSFKITISNT